MFITVLSIFIIYGALFIIFEDFDRRQWVPLSNPHDWRLLGGSLLVMVTLGFVLHRYSKRMDQRISREQAEKENAMRRQLTQNIAHELKTPVASILGYTETLIDNPDIDAQTRDQFIRRTHAQATRLTSLLSDLSTLNQMDYAAHLQAKEPVNLSSLVADIVQEAMPLLNNHNQTLRNCLPPDLHLNGNPFLLYSIFRNLLSNAINYAGNGTTIEITATPLLREWSFTFSDTGTGVAPEHLPHLFERFYRIDKGRSRQMGGTGLGLAIVKNAVIHHGGTIEVTHNTPSGLRFVFTLKKN